MWWAVLGFILWHSPQTAAQARCWGPPAPHSGCYYLDFSDEGQGHLQSHGQKKAKPRAKVCPGLFGANYDMTPLCCSLHRTWFNLTLVWDMGFSRTESGLDPMHSRLLGPLKQAEPEMGSPGPDSLDCPSRLPGSVCVCVHMCACACVCIAVRRPEAASPAVLSTLHPSLAWGLPSGWGWLASERRGSTCLHLS